ncbi:hypothetical protein JOB18_023528 [Solea senegalensis]|uniref:Uncharacterized protein n=1 Tax=Solea senegalensis TaxID=28829 RepID=A0AAV6T7K6_SOLSE|nr:hypothetical protein JOB18_023528 [Solea senegalensis]
MEVTPYASKPLSFCQGSSGLAALIEPSQLLTQAIDVCQCASAQVVGDGRGGRDWQSHTHGGEEPPRSSGTAGRGCLPQVTVSPVGINLGGTSAQQLCVMAMVRVVGGAESGDFLSSSFPDEDVDKLDPYTSWDCPVRGVKTSAEKSEEKGEPLMPLDQFPLPVPISIIATSAGPKVVRLSEHLAPTPCFLRFCGNGSETLTQNCDVMYKSSLFFMNVHHVVESLIYEDIVSLPHKSSFIRLMNKNDAGPIMTTGTDRLGGSFEPPGPPPFPRHTSECYVVAQLQLINIPFQRPLCVHDISPDCKRC